MFAAANALAQSDVVISQYIETNSGTTPKGIEVFNVSGSAIDFSVSNLQVYQGTNGGGCGSIVTITSGTLAVDEVWVIGTSNLITYVGINGTDLSGVTTYNFGFNGDDALQLYLGGVLQDEFGTCGSDPGSSWSGGGVSTANNNLQLKDAICDGSTAWTDPSARFDQIANGSTMTGFGNAPASCGAPPANTISTSAVIGAPFCVGNGISASLNVAYTITGTFNGPNVFSAELSNAGGSFGAPTVIGTLASTSAGTVSCVIPVSIASGSGYRIRVVGDDPSTVGSDNGTDLTVENFDAPTSLSVSCGNTEASAAWTNPECFDEVMVVASTSAFTTALPSGTYSSDLTFGSGDAFDGGFAVYAGSATSTGVISSLTNGTLYYFKVFSRKGSVWLAGDELSCTPADQCGDESFTNLTAPAGSYGAGSYTGDNSVNWSYSEARTVTSTDNITGTSIGFGTSGTRFAKANSTASGVGEITFSMTSYFTGGGASDRTIEVYVNGSLKGTYTLAAMGTVYTETVTANEPGLVEIEFRSTGSRQVVIDDVSWTCAGTLPTITVSTTSLTGFTYIFNSGPSAVQLFTVEGTDLTDDISISLPTDYEISTTNSPFTAAVSAIVLSQTGGTVSSTTIYIRLKAGLAVATYNGDGVDCSSTGASTRSVTCDGEVTPIVISVTTGSVSSPPFALTSCTDTESGSVAFTSTGTFSGGNVYSVQISDAVGDFSSPSVIGTLSSTANSGSVAIIIPSGSPGGTGYKVRVVSSNPVEVGTESAAFTITTTCVPQVLEAGDLAILAFNTNVDGTLGFDEISFVSFIDILPGTTIDFTDNAYEKCGTPNGWGISEGWFRMVRTTNTLGKGEIVTILVEYGNASVVSPDQNWNISKPQPSGQGNFDLNADGEQLFILSGGNVGGPSSSSPTSDAGTYSGDILYGFNTKGNIWTPVCGNAASGGTKNSEKPIDFDCFLVWPTAQADKNKYTGPMTTASQRDWLYRINTSANWTGYADNASYEAGPDFIDFNGPNAGRTIVITLGGFGSGLWTGETDENWHNCRNWQSLRIPDTNTDVTVPPTTNKPHINTGQAGICNTINIQSDSGAKLYIDGTGTFEVTGP